MERNKEIDGGVVLCQGCNQPEKSRERDSIKLEGLVTLT